MLPARCALAVRNHRDSPRQVAAGSSSWSRRAASSQRGARRVPSVSMAGNGAVHHAGIEFLQVQTMTDSRAEAMELARAAVEARLAAGTQVAGPMASTFWWNEEIERAEEWFVFFKTTTDRVEELITFIADRHS